MRERFWTDLDSDLKRLKKLQLYRDPEVFSSPSQLIDFSSNDYLGLAHHPRVVRAAKNSVQKWGAGSSASRLLSGNLQIHADLEKALARFKKEEDALVFSSGYAANLSIVTSLLNEKDVVIMDRLNHASLIDAGRLSRAKFWVYPHLDMDALSDLLKRTGSFRRVLVATDAYFSMDGDVAPLNHMLELCESHGALLMIDEAHSTGVFGEGGRGLTEHYQLSSKIPIVMGTLSKALGATGGFVAGDQVLKKWLVNTARPFIYTTAPTPAASGAALEAIRVIHAEPQLRKKLWNNVSHVRESLMELGYDLMHSIGPIIPIRAKGAAHALEMKEFLKKAGFFVPAIRPPSVPRGTERLRLSISSAQGKPEIEALLKIFKKMRDKKI